MLRSLASVLIVGGLSSVAVAQEVGPGVPPFDVRDGYRVTLAAEGLQEARFLQFGDDGTLYVSQPRGGRIVSLKDTDGDGTFETQATFVEGHPSAHSLDFADGWLYFTQSETGAAHRARDTNGDGQADETEVVLPEGSVPRGGGHPYRGILVADDAIYITVSDPSNMLDDLDSDRKTIYRFNRDGSDRTVFATGIRNTEKIRFRPGTTEVWGADHGSDWFGGPYGERRRGPQPITDMNPPEELNHYVEGGFYGHPFLVGHRVPRPEFADHPQLLELAAQTIPPAMEFGAHWAPNGFTFLTTDALGDDHAGDMFIAFHGSWNRSEKGGYRVQRVLFDEQTGRPYGQLMIVGTLGEDGEQVLARPVDCAEAPDGSVLFSCDHTQKVFRITRADE